MTEPRPLIETTCGACGYGRGDGCEPEQQVATISEHVADHAKRCAKAPHIVAYLGWKEEA